MHAWDVLGLDNLIAPNIFYLRSNLLGANNTMFENGQKYLIEFSLCQKSQIFIVNYSAKKVALLAPLLMRLFSKIFKHCEQQRYEK